MAAVPCQDPHGRIALVNGIPRISLIIRAVRELGFQQTYLYGIYQLGLRSGYYRWRTNIRRQDTQRWKSKIEDSPQKTDVLNPVLSMPDPGEVKAILGDPGLAGLIQEADEIVSELVRLFGGDPVPLSLVPPGRRSHWTSYEKGKGVTDGQDDRVDIKFIWEPCRFGWAFVLGRAYHLTGDEAYPGAFWRCFEIFQEANPVNMGPNWVSAQEVALRIIAFTFADQVFEKSPHSTHPRRVQLAEAIANHAARIPVTLAYSRSQNNNHLLSESAGLISASLTLPDHPQSGRWGKLGWKWFNQGLASQIAEDGAYTQHSTNYHRLMLQLVLWVFLIQEVGGRSKQSEVPSHFSEQALGNIGNAVRWLLARHDPESGRVPNLGPNDGTYILPLTGLPYDDYRPIIQTSSAILLGKPYLDPGPWDEMCLWFQSDLKKRKKTTRKPEDLLVSSIIRRQDAWACLRTVHFSDRPGHCDQLHLDLWWRGINIAQDAGTYLYNAAPPWDNALTNTAVHNTVMVGGQEQMTRAGKFLYLDWAQARMGKREFAQDNSWERISAWHDGYRHAGVTHMRTVTAAEGGRWLIRDEVFPDGDRVSMEDSEVRIHWLLPDWSYDLLNESNEFRVQSPHGWIKLTLNVMTRAGSGNSMIDMHIVRAGETLHGSGEFGTILGWVSPTYGVKVPALSFSGKIKGKLPIKFTSEWTLPGFSE